MYGGGCGDGRAGVCIFVPTSMHRYVYVHCIDVLVISFRPEHLLDLRGGGVLLWTVLFSKI